MRISTKGQYALEAMLALALAGTDDKVSIRQLGDWTNLSDSYLEQIFASLKKNHLVISNRGNRGGYQLSRSARDITAGEILRATEGSLSPVRCTDKNQNICKTADSCLTQSVWQHIDDIISREVDHRTLADLAAAYHEGGYNKTSNFVI